MGLAQPARLHAARFGIATTFVDPRDLGWRAAIRPETRLLFGETLGNPGLECSTSRAWRAAHDFGPPLLVDSTFTTPYLSRSTWTPTSSSIPRRNSFRPRRVIGGVLVDSGRFEWDGAGARQVPD
jgi:O-acetylhomoserine (thiol)-lyase